MYRIMLAEDETEVLRAVMETINWEAFSFSSPLGCRDGREAIACIEDGFVPDALITDIRMPFVDGLELTRYMAQHCPRTIVVVLSGHDEFVYAQQALQLQVYDYVLKPVTPASMNRLLEKLRDELDNRRLNRIEDSMEILQGYFLNRLTTKRLDSQTVEENCRRHKLSFSGGRHLVVLLDVDAPRIAVSDVTAGNDLELTRYALYNISGELTEQNGQVLAFQAQDGTTNLVVSARDAAACHELALETAERISKTVKQHLSYTISAGIGDSVQHLGELYQSHRQAVLAFSHRFFYGEASILSFCEIDERENAVVDVSPYYQEFESALKSYSRKKTDQVIDELFAYLGDNHWPIEKCILCCQKLVIKLHEFVNLLGDEREINALEEIWEQLHFYSAATINQLKEPIHHVCGEILELFESVSTDSAAAQVRKAESFIRSHYSDPNLSLQAITEHLSISVSYFSAIFKSHTGCTFVEYLTKVRMDKAKQMLALTDLRTYETAEGVGYTDPHYFSVAFKRFTGMSPREYREHSHRQTE